jgi:hypothetical protein
MLEELRSRLLRTQRRHDRRGHLDAYVEAIALLKALPPNVVPHVITSAAPVVDEPKVLVVQPSLFEEYVR